jgi:16S rRNA (adenine1518-N6/adenine1519-N6)-dimethyltransferase
VDNPIDLPPLDIPGLLKRHGLKPDKKLGQNFLIDPSYLERVAETGNIKDEDTVLEVGAGVGNLTRLLCIQANKILAVEVDPKLIPILEEVTNNFRNIQIIRDDILNINLTNLIPEKCYLVVANIPYYITSNLIRHLMTAKNKPTRLVLTIQKEVADRICAKAGNLSMLGLSVQVFGNPEIITTIPSGAFYPPPKVESAIVRIESYSTPKIPEELINTFFRIAKAGFSQKRKTLRNSLSAGLQMEKASVEMLIEAAGIDAMRRAETLSLEEWKSLTILHEKYTASPH